MNVRDNDGRTPMHVAAQEGHTNVVTLLAKEDGVDVNVQVDRIWMVRNLNSHDTYDNCQFFYCFS